MNLLSVLPELIKYEPDNDQGVLSEDEKGYNQCLSELEKYEICEEELALFIWNENKDFSTHWNFQRCEVLAKAIISSSHLWIKRKES